MWARVVSAAHNGTVSSKRSLVMTRSPDSLSCHGFPHTAGSLADLLEPEADRLLTQGRVCEFLDDPTRTLQRCQRGSELPILRTAGTVRIRESDLKRTLKEASEAAVHSG